MKTLIEEFYLQVFRVASPFQDHFLVALSLPLISAASKGSPSGPRPPLPQQPLEGPGR